MARSATTGIVFILAGLWVLWTLLIFGCALFYQFIGLDDGPDTHAASTLMMCSAVNFIIMILLIAIWHTKKKMEDRMDELASYLRMYRRTPLDNVASRMNIDVKSSRIASLEVHFKGSNTRIP